MAVPPSPAVNHPPDRQAKQRRGEVRVWMLTGPDTRNSKPTYPCTLRCSSQTLLNTQRDGGLLHDDGTRPEGGGANTMPVAECVLCLASI